MKKKLDGVGKQRKQDLIQETIKQKLQLKQTLLCFLLRKTRKRKEDGRVNRTATSKKAGSQINICVKNCIKTFDGSRDL